MFINIPKSVATHFNSLESAKSFVEQLEPQITYTGRKFYSAETKTYLTMNQVYAGVKLASEKDMKSVFLNFDQLTELHSTTWTVVHKKDEEGDKLFAKTQSLVIRCITFIAQCFGPRKTKDFDLALERANQRISANKAFAPKMKEKVVAFLEKQNQEEVENELNALERQNPLLKNPGRDRGPTRRPPTNLKRK